MGRARVPRGHHHCASEVPADSVGPSPSALSSWGRSADMQELGRGHTPSFTMANLCNHFATSCRSVGI